MPRPTEHHLRLQRIIGDWTGEETIYPSPWDPAGGKACARIVNRGSLDGFAVIQDYEQERNGNINFRGHAIFTWNTHEQCYVMYWFDSMGLPPLVLKGTFIDHILTLSNENPGGMSQAMFDFSKDNEYRYRMDVSQDGARWHTFMEGIYTK
ncbi:MAG TPA: DUF1579 family protein [Bacteroidota bacterium]|nr:DUF1579 family protein [Bacteroidota bacterium]